MPGPVTDARPGKRPTQSRVGPGGHRKPPAASTPTGAVGAADRWCWYCGGRGLVLATALGSESGTRVRCVCTQRSHADRVLRAIHLLLRRRGFPPTVRELAAETGLPPSTVGDALWNLHARGLIRRRAGIPRALEVPR